MKSVEIRELEILNEAVDLIVKECSPRRVSLFGSRAKGKAKAGSDFDFAVEGLPPRDSNRRKLKDMLESIAGLYSVNLVFLSEVDEKFKNIILESGRVIYEQKGN